MNTVEGYEPLAEVLQLALNQAQHGKGKERHANDKPFLQQPIAEIGRMVGTGYNIGQAMKKGQEAMRLPAERAQAELLGAINYMAAAYLLIGEQTARAAFEQPVAAPECSKCGRDSLGPCAFKEILAETGECSYYYRKPAPPLSEPVEVFAEKDSPFTFPAAEKFMGLPLPQYLAKLREEVDEVATARTYGELVEELCDVIHVAETAMREYCKRWGIDPAEVVKATIAKNQERGYYEAEGKL